MNLRPESESNAAPQLIPPVKKNKKKLYGALGGAALALAVAFGGSSLIGGIPTTSAQTTTPSTTPGAKPAPQNGSGTAQPGQNGTGTQQGGKGPHGGGPGRGGPGGEGGRPGPGGFEGGPGGTISAISGSTITITRGNGNAITTTVTVNDSTTYTDAGKKIALSDLAVGEKINVRTTKASDGTVTVTAIDVIHDHLGGKVTAISGNTITVESGGRPGFGPGPRGNGGTNGTPSATPSATPSTGSTASAPVTTTRTITVDGSTTFNKGGQTAALSDIAVGDRIDAAGTLNSDKSALTALQVNIELPHYGGKVTSVNGNTIVIDERGTSRTINVTADTKYLNGADAAALTDVKADGQINAEGTVDANGVMTATTVQVGHPAGPGGKGPGGFGGPKGGGR